MSLRSIGLWSTAPTPARQTLFVSIMWVWRPYPLSWAARSLLRPPLSKQVCCQSLTLCVEVTIMRPIPTKLYEVDHAMRMAMAFVCYGAYPDSCDHDWQCHRNLAFPPWSTSIFYSCLPFRRQCNRTEMGLCKARSVGSPSPVSRRRKMK